MFDELGARLRDALQQGEAAAMPAMISAVLAKTDLGSLQGVVATPQQGSLFDQS
jgi:hypothetical protein